MRKAQVTYRAPPGDNKTVTMGGVTFKDGESVEINSDDNPHLVSKLPGNPHFDVEVGEEEKSDPKRKPGRPPKVEPVVLKTHEEIAANQAAFDKQQAKPV